ATVDGKFRAFDARNGAELWSTKLDAPAHSIPSTYMGRDGKQYVVIAAGGGGFLQSPTADTLIAFTLPLRIVMKRTVFTKAFILLCGALSFVQVSQGTPPSGRGK